jgi:hypothetical protein
VFGALSGRLENSVVQEPYTLLAFAFKNLRSTRWESGAASARPDLDIESELDMELFLNSVWALVVIAGAWSWLRHGKHSFAAWRTSLVAQAMLVLILFPVISVSDDLWSVHNPAETDTCLKRDHAVVAPHSIFPTASALPEPVFSAVRFGGWLQLASQRTAHVPVSNLVFEAIQNRPPPTA